MNKMRTAVAHLLGVGALAAMLAGPALASDDDDDDPKLAFSFNIAATSDYVFRGFSQNAEDPTLQGGADVTYGMLYAGVWASGIDFGLTTPTGSPVATAEVDLYAGITPKLGPVDLDLGVIYYAYPQARDAGAELDYWELKVGASTKIATLLGLGATVYYSPEYTGKTGQVWTIEGSASVDLPKVAMFSPSISALVGTSISDSNAAFITAFSDDSYVYWNAGIALGVDKLSLDFRYWDTDVSAPGFCSGATFQCDERFVFTASFTY